MNGPTEEDMVPASFLEAMRTSQDDNDGPVGRGSIQQTTVRLPAPVEIELKGIADVHGVSMNVMIVEAIDHILRKHGRAGVVELAPWAPSYYRRDRCLKAQRVS
jgi:hypothetical protein